MFGVKGFGSVEKPRGFQYKPRYWNQEKEEWERKKEEYRAKGVEYSDDDEYAPGRLIQRQRIRRMSSSNRTQKNSATIIIRCVSFCFLLIIAILVVRFLS